MTHSPYGDFERVSVALCRMETDQGGYFLHSRGFRGSREIGERILRLTTDEDYEWAARRMDALGPGAEFPDREAAYSRGMTDTERRALTGGG